jgi:hypothetical protein
MDFHSRRAAAVALAVALSLPIIVDARPRQEPERDRGVIVSIVKKIKKIIGVTTNDDGPQPPLPIVPKP